MALRDSQDLPNVGEMPYQPGWHSFPKCAFGKTNVSRGGSRILGRGGQARRQTFMKGGL